MIKATWVGKSLVQLTDHSPPSGKPEQELKANTEAEAMEEHCPVACSPGLTQPALLYIPGPPGWAPLTAGWARPQQLTIQKVLCRQATGTLSPDPRCVMVTPEISYCRGIMGVTKTSQSSVPLRTLRSSPLLALAMPGPALHPAPFSP